MLPEIQRFDKWLRRRHPHTTTRKHYLNDLKLFFTWADTPPNAITLRDVDRYIEHCHQLGHAVATINRRLATLRTFYWFLDIECDGAPPNPVIPKRHFIPQGDHLPRDVEDTDVEQLLDVIESPRDRAMVLLMLRCGLRVQEVHNLSLADLYLDPAPANLPRLWLNGKRSSQRVVYLSHQALTALQDWLAVRPVVETEAVFVSRLGRRISVRTIQDRLTRYCRQVGVRVSCHQLRHTFGRHMVEARVPITSIQKLLGHKSVRTTQIYLHITDPQVQADYDAAMAQFVQRLSAEGGAE
jgi:site-specific recombinase XerC